MVRYKRTSLTFFSTLVVLHLLAINLLFSPHNPYQEKNNAFECGFHYFSGKSNITACKIVCLHKRTYHTATMFKDRHNPLVVYKDIRLEKTSILKNNKGKTGVYC
jgi:hypothetical protein